jgi:hypothetical protein
MQDGTADSLAGARRARFHLQVALSWTDVRPPPVFTPCRGTVLRVWRGGEEVRTGDVIHFCLPLLARIESVPAPADGSAWFHVNAFASTPIVEVLLDGVIPDLQLADGGHGCRLLAAPTEGPATPRPTAQVVREAIARERGTFRTVFFRDAQAESVSRTLAAHGARLVSARENSQEWILDGDGGHSLRLWLTKDYQELFGDPEVWLEPLQRLVAGLLFEPRVVLDLHWYPAMAEPAQSLMDDLLEAHLGLVRSCPDGLDGGDP